VRFDLKEFEPFSVSVDGKSFGYKDCYIYAQIANLPAGIHEVVFKSRTGLYAEVTVIAEEGADGNAYGLHHGWYTARIISEEEAKEVRSSWAVLREQPLAPSGPWA